jgi:hypothetical protein
MKRFIKYFLFFTVPIFLFSYFIDIFLSNYLKKSNKDAFGEFSTWNDLYDGKINSDIVIYGSSRAWRHINPTMIEDSLHISAYNLGIDGHNFWLQNLRHTILLEKNKTPKLIIYSLDLFTLKKNKDLYNSEQFLPYMLWNRKIKEATIGYNGFNSLDYEIPLIRYYGKYFEIIKAGYLFINPQRNKIKRVKGYQGQEESWNSDFDKVKSRMKSLEIPLDKKTIILFDRFLKECKSQKIEIIFVYSPEYIEGQRFVKNKFQIISIYRKFSKKYNIPFYDYSNDSMSYKKEYFYNALHLNKTGAELFTSRLIDTLKSTNLVKTLIKN